ncbi:hypothetical protein EJB05_34837, partial [Eragrostis curvula]
MFLRLYFNPSTYGNYSPLDAYFGVTAGNLTLLDNFNASRYALTINTVFFSLEYSVSVTSGRLELTFAPSTHQNGSYAFINGIEIVPTPDLFTTATLTLTDGEKRDPFPIDPTWGFQTMYRLNVGGDDISPRYDVDFYRSWSDDTPYIYGPRYGKTFKKDSNITITYTPTVPKYSAPIDVYATARTMGADAQVNLKSNLTWNFLVDAGFYYILRFHFCEIQYLITKINQRSFSIYINNLTALHQIDVIALSLGIGRAVYLDYAILTTGCGQMDLWIALHPDLSSSPEYYDAILNGIEIFKLQLVGENSLAMLMAPPPPSHDVEPNGPSGGRRPKRAAPAVISGAVGGFVVLIIACIGLCIVCQHKKVAMEYARTDNNTECNGRLRSNYCHHFTFKEIQAATSNFDETFLLGKGGFGNVYCRKRDRGIKVAIKRGNPLSQQGIHEFRTEIEMLTLLRHRHLVSLIGYCEENNEMILVYDYMANGSLREHLYDTKKSPLPWKQRLGICIDAAQGLHYLHDGAERTIIHRDVKTANILLDDKMVAKVSDFGLSKASLNINDTHVSTAVKGTFGYLDPEYFRRKLLTQKSDVYSRTSKCACATGHCIATRKGNITLECFRTFAETAEHCVADRSMDRPSMGDVLQNLQIALQLQDGTMDNRSYAEATTSLTKKWVASANPSTDSTMSVAGQGAVFSDIAYSEEIELS